MTLIGAVPTEVDPVAGLFIKEMVALAKFKGVRGDILMGTIQRWPAGDEPSPEQVVNAALEYQQHLAMSALKVVPAKAPTARRERGYDSVNSIQDVENAAIEEARRPGATRASVESVVWQRSVVGDKFGQKMQRGLMAGLAELKKVRIPKGVTVTHRQVEVDAESLKPVTTEE